MQNNANTSFNLQLNGGFYPLHNASLADEGVEPGDVVEYRWSVQAVNGPTDEDMSSVGYVYGSNVDPTGDVNAGLYGLVVITRPVRLQIRALAFSISYFRIAYPF